MSNEQVYVVKFGLGVEVFSTFKRAITFIRNISGVNYGNAAIGAISNVELEDALETTSELNFDQFGNIQISLIKRDLR